MPSKEAIVRVCLSIRSALAELEFVSLANAGSGGYNAVQNRSLLCNALISALEIARAASPDGTPDISDSVASDRLPVALHAELLAFFVLLHADEAQTMPTVPAPRWRFRRRPRRLFWTSERACRQTVASATVATTLTGALEWLPGIIRALGALGPQLRLFLGHSGWGARQLDGEWRAGAWRLCGATAAAVFAA